MKIYKPKSKVTYRPSNTQAQAAARHFGRLNHARAKVEYIDGTPGPATLIDLLSRTQTIHSD